MCTAFGSWCAGASSNSFPPSEKVNKQIMKYCETRIMWDSVAVVCTILAVEMFVVQADGKLKEKGRRSTLRNVSFYRVINRWSKYSRLKLLLRSKMAEGVEQVLVENGKEDERELDLAKCAAEFAHYCQVDVRKEVWHPSTNWLEKHFARKIDISSLLVRGGRFLF